jgi:hypothetical protein
MKPLFLLTIAAFIVTINTEIYSQNSVNQATSNFSLSPKPYARYWWFASEIQKQDVAYNLDWLKNNGFGGVELAWVYPLNRFNAADTSYTPRQEWLSAEWQEIVSFTIQYADSIGLGCDMTFGSLWPFGDSKVSFDQASQKFGDSTWRQEIKYSWEHPKKGFVVDHITPSNYLPYFSRLTNAFPKPKLNHPQAWFIDSWEVETDRLWSNSFEDDFQKAYGYNISPFMDSIYNPKNAHQLYDYSKLLSQKVLRFYAQFDSTLNSAGVLSRGQVSGAPCDLISGYALLDIPEGESMLFEPEFCALPSSASLLSRKKYTSAEAFTCIYGWPRDYMRKEQTADLKLVADALFANGINHFVWHGKPHNEAQSDSVNFYATTHIGSISPMATEFTEFNNYLERVSDYMSLGKTYTDIAVYLPTEDAWMAGVMPEEDQFKWAWGFYEMRYNKFPKELGGMCPAWINGEFLRKADFTRNRLRVGDATFKALYVDAQYIDYESLSDMVRLANKGLNIILKQLPTEPGIKKHADYDKLVYLLSRGKKVYKKIPEGKFLQPLIISQIPVEHWVRISDKTMYIFFANPNSSNLKFPLEMGQSFNEETKSIPVTVFYNYLALKLVLDFEPYQSLLYKIDKRKIEKIDIEFTPKSPVQIKRPDDFKAPWLVK